MRILIFCAVVTAAVGQYATCLSGFTEAKGSCYKIIRTATSFDESRKMCQALGPNVDIGTIRCEYENNKVLEIFESDKQMLADREVELKPRPFFSQYEHQLWIGIHAVQNKKLESGLWLNDRDWGYRNWKKGEPNGMKSTSSYTGARRTHPPQDTGIYYIEDKYGKGLWADLYGGCTEWGAVCEEKKNTSGRGCLAVKLVEPAKTVLNEKAELLTNKEATDCPAEKPNVVQWPVDDACWNKHADAPDDFCGEGAIRVKSDEGNIELFIGASCNCGSTSSNIYGIDCRERCSKTQYRNESDMCASQGKQCYLDTPGSPVCGCEFGSKEVESNGVQTCVSRNLCQSCLHKCHKTSSCVIDSTYYKCTPCSAEMGYKGASGMQCNNINECDERTDMCDEANSVCIDRDPIYDDDLKYECLCKAGWRGNPLAGFRDCPCQDEDECALGTDECDKNSVCKNNPGSYVCECKTGFRKTAGSSKNCTNINECKEKTAICHAFADCQDTEGSYTCTCKGGYLGDGKQCEPDKEVQCKPCDTYTTECRLNNVRQKYICSCLDGFDPLSGNENMCIDKDECIEKAHDCNKHAVCNNTVGSYNCECAEGYEGDGKNCTPISICKREDPCGFVANAVCEEIDGKAVCVCKPRFVRQLADINNMTAPCYDEDKHMVKNCTSCDPVTEICVDAVSGPYQSCMCREGMIRSAAGYCENIIECQKPSDHDCDENAICFDLNPAIDNGQRYKCSCKVGYTGNGKRGDCKDIIECDTPNMCDPETEVCNNTIGSFVCNCQDQYNRPNRNGPCVNIDQCALGLHDCPMRSKCINEVPGYKCECDKGFKLVEKDGIISCENIDECGDPNVCDRVNGICTDTPGSYICSCKPGFELLPVDRKTCRDKDECLLEMYQCDRRTETCNNTIGSYDCLCLPGLERVGDECKDIDECTRDLYHCYPNSTCVNEERGYKCVCDGGFEKTPESHPKKPVCKGVSMCDLHYERCHPGKCVDTTEAPFYDCECISSSVKVPDSQCQGCSKCVWPNYCDDNFPCPSNGECSNNACVCKPGHRWVDLNLPLTETSLKERDNCEVINKCKDFPKICGNMFCKFTGPGNFTCECSRGHEYVDGDCHDIDECHHPAYNIECPPHSYCENIVGSYKCTCEQGYAGAIGSTEREPVCRDVNECLNGDHNCTTLNAKCRNQEPGFECDCPSGYKLQAPNYDNCTDINECKDKLHECHKFAKCINVDGSYNCECRDGFSGNGYTCWDNDECADWTHNCTIPHQVCYNLEGSFGCECDDGFELIGNNCTDYDECKHDTCNNCSTLGGPTPKICVNTIGSFVCTCPEGYTDVNGNCEDIDECLSSPCPTGFGDFCHNTAGSFECLCREGYRKPSKSSNHLKECENIIECKEGIIVDGKSQPACGPNTNCTDTIGGYMCECKKYHSGDPYTTEGCKPSDLCNLYGKCNNVTEDCFVKNEKPECHCKENYIRNVQEICQIKPCHLNNGGCGANSTCIDKMGVNVTAECVCPEGQTLDKNKNCQFIDYCQCEKSCTDTVGCNKEFIPHTDACRSASRCTADHMLCKPEKLGYNCICEWGFKLSENKTACINIDECEEGIMQNKKDIPCGDGECIDETPGWTCKCPRGFFVDHYGQCSPDIQCIGEQKCKNIPHSYCEKFEDPLRYHCECEYGYEGDATVESPCNKIDYCDPFPCKPEEECKSLQTEYSCQCAQGFRRNMTTMECDDINECEENCAFCLETFVCHNIPGSYECNCPEGYIHNTTTNRCQDFNECEIPGTCDEETEDCKNLPGTYKCSCKQPEYRLDNGECIPVDVCKTAQYICPKYSTCVPLFPGYNCSCPKGYTNIVDPVTNRVNKCENIDECKGNPCPDGAECIDTEGSYKCDCKPPLINAGVQDCVKNTTCEEDCDVNAYCLQFVSNHGTYNCTCGTGYTGDGKSCTNIDECHLDPCHEKATCKDTPGSFICTCKAPYAGDGILDCKRVDVCKENKYNDCPINAECKPLPGDEPVDGKFVTCVCPSGFEFNSKTRQCDNIDECKKDPCDKLPLGITCIDNDGSYTCSCPQGYKPDGKNSCKDIDECIEGNGADVCKNAICANKNGTFECICKVGFEHLDATKLNTSCHDIEECAKKLDDCDRNTTDCLNNFGSYACICHHGLNYVPNSDYKKCENINECAMGIDTCKRPQELCHDTYGSFYCNCSNGYDVNEKTKECEPSDQCDTECGLNAFCVKRKSPSDPNKLEDSCVCKDGYFGDATVVCEPVPDCNNGTECPSNSKCIELQLNNGTGGTGSATYTCVCDPSYEKVGSQCVPIPYCDQPNVCGEKEECVFLNPGYRCACLPGAIKVETQASNVTCEEVTCANQGKQRCSPDAECIDEEHGGYTCKCKKNFIGNGVGAKGCELIDICETYPQCSLYADCKNEPRGDFTCTCKAGFTGNGTHCYNIDECKEPGVCDKNAKCIDTQGSYKCSCNTGYTGNGRPGQCKNIDECKENTDDCDDSTTKCEDMEPLYRCDCKSGYKPIENSNTTCQNIDECKDPSLNTCTIHTCNDLPGTYDCTCLEGYEPADDKKSCININECNDADACMPNEDCRDTEGSYTCQCSQGFTKEDSDECVPIDLCKYDETNKCDKRTTTCEMIPDQREYVCNCKGGYQIPITSEKVYKCVNINECEEGHPSYNELTMNCNDTDGSFDLWCKEGLDWNQQHDDCIDIDECAADPAYAESLAIYKSMFETGAVIPDWKDWMVAPKNPDSAFALCYKKAMENQPWFKNSQVLPWCVNNVFKTSGINNVAEWKGFNCSCAPNLDEKLETFGTNLVSTCTNTDPCAKKGCEAIGIGFTCLRDGSDGYCVCDASQGYKERLSSANTAYCSKVECEVSDPLPTSIKNMQERALVSCVGNEWTPNKGYTLIRDPIKRTPISVEDNDECESPTFCCDTAKAQCSTKNGTDNPCALQCINVPGSAYCTCTGYGEADAHYIETIQDKCTCTVKCTRTSAWYMKCLGDTLKCNMDLLKTIYSGENAPTGKICSRISDSNSGVHIEFNTALDYLNYLCNNDNAASADRRQCGFSANAVADIRSLPSYNYDGPCARTPKDAQDVKCPDGKPSSVKGDLAFCGYDATVASEYSKMLQANNPLGSNIVRQCLSEGDSLTQATQWFEADGSFLMFTT